MVISGSDGVTFPDSTNQFSGGAFSFKNRIINGAMVIDQRNAGASVTLGGGSDYIMDRFRGFVSAGSKLSVQQSTDAPTGFSNSALITVASSYTPSASEQFFFGTSFEANNVGDFSFGTASAKTTTLSFWVKSSVTGTYPMSWTNNATDRSYIKTFTISSADTWEQKTITIPGDTTGTWVNSGTGRHSFLQIGLGAGSNFDGTDGAWQAGNLRQTSGSVDFVSQSNGATFYITGVQLEVGSVATPFERRPFGAELVLCKRYYDKTFAINTAPAQNAGRSGALETVATRAASATGISSYFRFSVPMRATPSTITFYNPSAANGQARNLDLSSDCTSTSADNINEIGGKVNYTLPASTVATNLISVHWSADAEL
jgi:hypothetical protein